MDAGCSGIGIMEQPVRRKRGMDTTGGSIGKLDAIMNDKTLIRFKSLTFPVPFDPDHWTGEALEVEALTEEQAKALEQAIAFTQECCSF